MAKIVWVANYMGEPTGYGRVTEEVLPRLQHDSDHEIVHFANSGIQGVTPFEEDGITVYGRSNAGGELGIPDMPVVNDREDPDFWLWHFDVWAAAGDISQLPFEPVLYPPIDHDPLTNQWVPALRQAREVVPFCRFGQRVIQEGVGDSPEGFVREPIYHGVDPETFRPTDVTPTEAGIAPDDDRFVVGIFKANQGTRWKPFRQLRAFKQFIETNNLRNEAVLYVHSNRRGRSSFDLGGIVQRLGLEGNVKLADPQKYRYGYDDAELNRLYNACDVLLNTTAGEGFGLPILEGMAAGTPPIVNAYSSMPELVLGEEGEIRWQDIEEPFIRSDRGYAIPVWDMEPTTAKHSFRRTNRAKHIATALTHAYENPDELAEMGEHAREFAVQYDWDTIASQWADYFTNLEQRTYTTDDDGIEWETVDTEAGGVGGHGG